METGKKKCLSCEKPLQGRADKKFCDHYCRNAYNNLSNSSRNNYMRSVDGILRRNRRLLQKEIGRTATRKKIRRDRLAQLGFDFRYYTHQLLTRKGHTCFFTYEYGYLPAENGEWLWLVAYKI